MCRCLRLFPWGVIHSVLLFHCFMSDFMGLNDSYEIVLWTWRVDFLSKRFERLPGAGVVGEGFVDSFYFG